MKTNLDCTIIFLSYNSREVTDTCLRRLQAAVIHSEKNLRNNIQILVVDNASKDGSIEMIKKKYPRVKLFALKKNIGYSAGNNLAMKKASTPYILLMNSDTYVMKDSVTKIISKMIQKKECDVLVSRYSAKKEIFENHGGHLPTPLRYILWSFGFESIPYFNHFFKKVYSMNRDFYNGQGYMEWYSPCFMLIKRKVFDLTKGYDENLWFHMVDVEWFKRIYDKKLLLYYTPDIHVIHLGGASSKGIEISLIEDNFKGVMYYFKKHYPKKTRIVVFFLKQGLIIRSIFYFLAGKYKVALAYFTSSRILKA
jgi:GT2 family glycosyltransferase